MIYLFRLIFLKLSPSWKEVLFFVRPETVIRWHRKFVPPDHDLGCDVASCEALAGHESSFPMVEYELTGTKTLTSAEKEEIASAYPQIEPEQVPDTLNEYITRAIDANLQIEITYYNDNTCNSETVPSTYLDEFGVQSSLPGMILP